MFFVFMFFQGGGGEEGKEKVSECRGVGEKGKVALSSARHVALAALLFIFLLLSIKKTRAFFSSHLDVDALRVDLRAERLDVDEVGRDRQRHGVSGEANGAELIFF